MKWNNASTAEKFLVGMLWINTWSCAAKGTAGECSETIACDERGYVCNTLTNVCELGEWDPQETASKPSGGQVSDVYLPFFRGRVCMATDLKPGDPIIASFEPCLHPCLSAASYKLKQSFSCDEHACEAVYLQWYEDVKGSCPNDVHVFGQFAASECVYPEKPITLDPKPLVINGGVVSGDVVIEIPFLRNADMEEIAKGADKDRMMELIHSYPQDPERVFVVQLNSSYDSGPEHCTSETCTCKLIGFTD